MLKSNYFQRAWSFRPCFYIIILFSKLLIRQQELLAVCRQTLKYNIVFLSLLENIAFNKDS